MYQAFLDQYIISEWTTGSVVEKEKKCHLVPI
jgi:hypothetical protein